MNETARLIIKVDSDGVTRGRNELGRFEKQAVSTERATDRLMGAFKRLITVAAALGAFRAATNLLADFEEGMSQVRAISGATEAEFTRLSATARKLGADTRYSAREAADGMQFLAQAGFNTNQIISAMPGMLDLATAGALDLASAADIASNIMSGFNLQAEESGKVADILAIAAAQSNTNVFQLGDAMKYVAPISASLGINIEDTATAIGILSNAGLQGSMAGTGLRQVLSSLASPTKEAADIIRAYGVSLDEVNPATHSLTEIIGRLGKAGVTAGDALEIFGDRGAPAFLALTSQAPAFDRLSAAVYDSAGAAKEMAAIMGDNLRGDFKELASASEELILKIGDAGLTQSLRDGTQAATDFVRALNDMAESGEIAAWADFVMSKFDLIDDGFGNLADNIIALWTMAMDWLTGDGESTVKGLIDIFVMLPENVRAVAQGIGASFGLIVEYASASGKGIYEAFVAWFDYLVDTAKNVGEEIMSHLNPRADDFDYVKAQTEAYDKFAAKAGGAWDTVTQKIGFATEAWEEQIVAIMDEWDANTAASDDKLARIEQLRAAYKKLKADREAAEGSKPETAPIGIKPQSDGQSRFQTREFDALRKQLQLEEKTVEESYKLRLELIRKNTVEGSELRSELEASLNERHLVEMQAAQDATAARLEAQYSAEQQLLQNSLDSRLITEQQFQEKSRENWNKYTKNLINLTSGGARTIQYRQLEMHAQVLSLASDISGQLSDLAGENNAAAKAMFVASKAIAIAQALVYTELAATRALAEGGFYLGIPMASVIRGLGYASIGLMAGTAIAEGIQKFEHGGMIPAGKLGMVNEAGAELVRGPAVVTSARATADLMAGQGGANVQVVVNNFSNEEVQVTQQNTADGKMIELIVGKAKKEIAAGIRNGGTEITKALESVYPLRRGVA